MFSRHNCKLKCYCRNQFKCENDKICCPYDDVISEYQHGETHNGAEVTPTHVECGYRMGEETIINRITGGNQGWKAKTINKKNFKTTLLRTSRSIRAQRKTIILVCKFLFQIRILFTPPHFYLSIEV